MTRTRPLVASALALALALALGACSSGGDGGSGDAGPADRQAVVAGVVDEAIAPLVRSASGSISAAADAVDAYCASPTPETLAAAQEAVDAGLDAYERLDPVDMGPIMLRRTDGHVAYPLDAERLEEQLSIGTPIDTETANKRTPSSTRGLTAAEYLLDATPAPGDVPLRCQYLVAITTNAADQLELVVADWFEGRDGEEPYVDRLAGRTANPEDAKETVDVIVNMAMSVLDADAALLADPGDQSPESIRRATASHLATIAEVWGTGDTGLSQLVDDELADQVAAELGAALSAALDDSVPADEVLADVELARATIGTEVVSALDVVVGFSENDGDS